MFNPVKCWGKTSSELALETITSSVINTHNLKFHVSYQKKKNKNRTLSQTCLHL